MKKNRDSEKESLLKKIRRGLRLKTKPPAVIRDKSKYTRKEKHKEE